MLNCLLVIPLLEQLISMLLCDFFDHFDRETSLLGDVVRYLEQLLFDQVIDLFVCIHLAQSNEFLDLTIIQLVFRHVKDVFYLAIALLLYLNIDDVS